MSRPSVRNRVLAAAVQAAVVAAAPGTAGAATLDFEPYVGAAIGYVDNIELNPDGQQQTSDGVLELEAGFNSRYVSPRFLGALNYRYRYLDYFSEDDFDSSYNNLGASARVIAVQELFYVDAGAFYQQVLGDPSSAAGFGNYFTPGNLNDAWGWNVTPVLTHDFGYATALVQYTYGQVNYKNSEQSPNLTSSDSTSKSLYASLATSDPRQPFSWKVFYSSSRTEYEVYRPYRYDQAGVELGWAVGKDWRLVGEYGLESDLTENVEQGGLETPYWNAGVVYEPNDRNRLEARAGERFWGDSYVFRFRHVARLADFEVSYLEEPTTNSYRVVAADDNTPPDEVPPFPDVPGFQDTRTEPYLLKRTAASVKVKGSRTLVDFSWFDDHQDYFETNRRVDSRAGQVGVTRELGPRSDVRVWFARRKWNDDPGTDTEDQVLAARFSRDLGRDFRLSAETAYQTRWESGEDRANGWWVGVRARKSF